MICFLFFRCLSYHGLMIQEILNFLTLFLSLKHCEIQMTSVHIYGQYTTQTPIDIQVLIKASMLKKCTQVVGKCFHFANNPLIGYCIFIHRIDLFLLPKSKSNLNIIHFVLNWILLTTLNMIWMFQSYSMAIFYIKPNLYSITFLYNFPYVDLDQPSF